MTNSSKCYRYTTEHIDDYHVLVRIYKRGERKIYRKFVVEYFDWNTVDDAIETMIESI